jgi:uncharacterized protein YbjT (DUF2867 family)
MTAPAEADIPAASRPALAAAAHQLGFVPNMYHALAATPKALNAWLDLRKAMSTSLDAATRQGIADDEIARNRGGSSNDTRRAAALAFAREVALTRGKVSDCALNAVRVAGFTDGQKQANHRGCPPVGLLTFGRSIVGGRHETEVTNQTHNSERFIMKIVVIGGRGLIGSKVASKLSAQGHDVITASRRSGVDSLTGEGLANAIAGADVLVDVADSPLFDDEPVMHFFTTTTTNLLSAEQEAGVERHVALSVVGAQIMPDSVYEFAVGLADSATDGDIVRLPHALFRPIAADDVATAVAHAAVGLPINGVTEIAGPEAMGMDDFVRKGLAAIGDQRRVVTDAQAPYFGAVINDHTLAPDENATIFTTRYSDWIDAHSSRRT